MSTRQTQNGFSLIELMVALVLGLVVSFAAINIYGAAASSVRGQDAERKVADRGAFALGVLGRHIRNAGFVEWTGSPTLQNLLLTAIPDETYRLTANNAQDLLAIATGTNVFDTNAAKSFVGIQTLHGCASAYASPASLATPACAPISAPFTAVSSPNHSITVATQVRRTADALLSSVLPNTLRQIPTTGSRTSIIAGDCHNRDTNGDTANPQGFLAVNRFYLEGTNIRCLGNGNPSPNTPDPVIASDIEQLVFRYGQAQPGVPAGVASMTYSGDQLVSTMAVANTDPTLTNPMNSNRLVPVTVWPLVTVVEICVLARGDEGSRSTAVGSATTYKDCNAITRTYPDNRLRLAMKSTVTLRNRIRAPGL